MSQPNSSSTSPKALPEQRSPDNQAGPSNLPRPTAAFKARSISFAGPSTGLSTSTPPRSVRRSSIQLAASVEESSASAKKEPVPNVPSRRPRSPPPPLKYHPRVSFDTFNNSFVPDQEFTLVCKHNGYTYGRHQRVFLVAIDQNSYSEHALKWVIEAMIEDGDEIICLRVVEPDPKTKEGATATQMLTYREDAKKLLKQIQSKNDAAHQKSISIIMEFAVGSVEQTILHMIQIYSPAFLTVGTRGKSLGGLQGLLPGSVSKWCVQNSPVPVVVVRHPEKRRRKMDKRRNDIKRTGYANLQDEISKRSGKESSNPMEEKKPIETEEGEAEAVAIAITKTISAFDKRAKKRGKGVERDENRILKLRGGRRSATSLSETGEREAGGQSESQSEDEGEEETDGEEQESDEDSEDSEVESPLGTGHAEGVALKQVPSDVGRLEHNLDVDVEGLTLDDEEGYRASS